MLICKLYPHPMRYEPEGFNGGPAIVDAKGGVVMGFFWPSHDPAMPEREIDDGMKELAEAICFLMNQ